MELAVRGRRRAAGRRARPRRSAARPTPSRGSARPGGSWPRPGVTTVALVEDDRVDYRMSLLPGRSDVTYDRSVHRGTRRATRFVPEPGLRRASSRSSWSAACMTWTGFGNVRVDVFLLRRRPAGWSRSACTSTRTPWSRYFAGDRGVADRGYLRLNPLKYTHPLLSIVLPVVVVLLGGIGLPGGAVWVDHRAHPRPAADIADQPGRPGHQRAVRAGAGRAVPGRLGRSIGTAGGSSAPRGVLGGAGAARRSCRSPRACSTCCRCPGLDGGNMLAAVAEPGRTSAAVRPVRPVRLHPALRAALAAADQRLVLRRGRSRIGDALGLPSAELCADRPAT